MWAPDVVALGAFKTYSTLSCRGQKVQEGCHVINAFDGTHKRRLLLLMLACGLHMHS